ncbi:hypothetical protein CBR_g24199 [Chara braunii]|uniref:CCHC-type domain-containing protein n=1 Tax=Chara braunii TaxID=69332 RepID=A0A388L687_CHABU|nr:hypothetical protein CBR_g24199 [Chara braunii]|eukprot:GBG77752.1 hypothetical protein CBR_g24199 [Chara braunii]
MSTATCYRLRRSFNAEVNRVKGETKEIEQDSGGENVEGAGTMAQDSAAGDDITTENRFERLKNEQEVNEFYATQYGWKARMDKNDITVHNAGYSKQFIWSKSYQPQGLKRAEQKRRAQQQEAEHSGCRDQDLSDSAQVLGVDEQIKEEKRQAAILEAQVEVPKDQNRKLEEDTINLKKIAYAPHADIDATAKLYARQDPGKRIILPYRWNSGNADWEVAIQRSLTLITAKDSHCEHDILKERITKDLPWQAHVIGDLNHDREEWEDTKGTMHMLDYRPAMIELQEKAVLEEGLIWMPWQVVETIPYGLLGGLEVAEWVARGVVIVTKADMFAWQPDYIDGKMDIMATTVEWTRVREALTPAITEEVVNYERDEFLGDALLKFFVTMHIFVQHPMMREGEMSFLREELVSNNSLFKKAAVKNLDRFMICERLSPACFSELSGVPFKEIYQKQRFWWENEEAVFSSVKNSLGDDASGSDNADSLMPHDKIGDDVKHVATISMIDKWRAELERGVPNSTINQEELKSGGAVPDISSMYKEEPNSEGLVPPVSEINREGSRTESAVTSIGTISPVEPKSEGRGVSQGLILEREDGNIGMPAEDEADERGLRLQDGKRLIKYKTLADAVEALAAMFYLTGGESACKHLLEWFGIPAGISEQTKAIAVERESAEVEVPPTFNLAEIENTLTYKFKNANLLVNALTHTGHEQRCYQRMEFIGDAVLDLVVAEHLYSNYPGFVPDKLTAARSMCVRKQNFARIAVQRQLWRFLRTDSKALQEEIQTYVKDLCAEIDKQQDSSLASLQLLLWSVQGPKVLGDIVEAIAGAILIDSGFDMARVKQPLVLTPEEIAIRQADAQEAQLQKALGEIKAEKQRMIRRRARMQWRQADISELEKMDLANMDANVYVKCKLTLPHEEVLVAASYLEGSAARLLSGLVQLQGYDHDFRARAVNQKLEDFLKLVEERWHDPQEAQKATDAILTLSNRPFKSVRDATDAVERLICVPGVRYEPQVLLTTYLRCLPMKLKNQLAGEANINVHYFPSFSKKALDLDAKIGHGHQPTTDGRKKSLPPNWKAKGRIMFVDNDGSTIELDDDFQEGVGSEVGSVETSGGGVVTASVQKGEAIGRCREGSRSRSQVDPNAPPWEKAGLTEDVWRDRYTRQTCIRCGQYGHNQFKCRKKKVTEKIPPTMGQAMGSSASVGSNVANSSGTTPGNTVLSLLRQHQIKINGEKCEFGRTRILYLGHEIFAEGLKPDDAKVASIRDWPRPQSMTEMRSFLGMTDYYHNFVKNYSIVAAPLTDLTRLDTPWEWTGGCEAAFRHLKHALMHHEVLKLPDPDKPFIVTTDASQYGIGAVPAQQEGPKLRRVEYMSKKMPSQKLAAEQGTQLQMTSGNHPEANGQAEQLNHAVQHLLRHYIKPNQVGWDEKLAVIATLYNNAVHNATGGTSGDDRVRRPSTFQAGDRVWVKSSELGQEHGISRKLMPQYFGPWEVLDIVGDDPDGPSYVVRIPGHLRTYPVFHASELAPFEETDQFPSRRSMLPPTMDGEVDVDDIVDHREMPVPRPSGRGRPPKRKLQYRVRFRHHTDPKEDRWFTREELMQTAPQVVAHYEKLLQKGKRQID